jgi:hypothetical protein
MSLIKTFGINIPNYLCMPAVIFGYIAVTFFQYWALNKTIQITDKRRCGAELNRIKKEIEVK